MRTTVLKIDASKTKTLVLDKANGANNCRQYINGKKKNVHLGKMDGEILRSLNAGIKIIGSCVLLLKKAKQWLPLRACFYLLSYVEVRICYEKHKS